MSGRISSSDAKKVLVIGDSHAEITWEIIAQNYGLAADIYLIRLGGCPFSDITRVINSLSPGDCSRFRRAIPSAIADIKPDTIVLSDYISGKNDNGTSISRSEIASGLRTSVTRYKKLASTVIVMGEFPTQPVGLTDCVLASGLLSRSCFGKVADTQYIRDLESKVALSLNVGFVDPTPIFCYSLICPPVIDNILVRRETNHTTDNFTLKVAPFFGFYFDKLGILGTP